MTRSRRPSAQTTAVVLALAEKPTAWRYGYQLCQQLGLKPGSLYPILVRLADRGLLETTWDTDVPAGRPPRHLYRLTGPARPHARGDRRRSRRGDRRSRHLQRSVQFVTARSILRRCWSPPDT
jgi:DNA-binding PadR family transcriptional regulator